MGTLSKKIEQGGFLEIWQKMETMSFLLDRPLVCRDISFRLETRCTNRKIHLTQTNGAFSALATRPRNPTAETDLQPTLASVLHDGTQSLHALYRSTLGSHQTRYPPQHDRRYGKSIEPNLSMSTPLQAHCCVLGKQHHPLQPNRDKDYVGVAILRLYPEMEKGGSVSCHPASSM